MIVLWIDPAGGRRRDGADGGRLVGEIAGGRPDLLVELEQQGVGVAADQLAARQPDEPARHAGRTESPRSCTTTFKLTAGPTAHDAYIVRLRVDDQPLVSASIKKDGFASVRAFGEKTVPVLAIITALLTAVGAFHKELWRSAAQLIGRGGDPPAAPPGVPQA